MRNLKVSLKLIISYALVLLLLVISIVMSVGELMSIRAKVETFYTGPFTVLNAANTVSSRFEAMQKSVFRAISNTDLEITKQALDNAKTCASEIQEQIPIIKDNFLGDQTVVERLNRIQLRLRLLNRHDVVCLHISGGFLISILRRKLQNMLTLRRKLAQRRLLSPMKIIF